MQLKLGLITIKLLTSLGTEYYVPLEVINKLTLTSQQKGIYPSFKTQGRYHQKFKTGYQCPHKRTYVRQNLKKKKRKQDSGKANIEFAGVGEGIILVLPLHG